MPGKILKATGKGLACAVRRHLLCLTGQECAVESAISDSRASAVQYDLGHLICRRRRSGFNFDTGAAALLFLSQRKICSNPVTYLRGFRNEFADSSKL